MLFKLILTTEQCRRHWKRYFDPKLRKAPPLSTSDVGDILTTKLSPSEMNRMTTKK